MKKYVSIAVMLSFVPGICGAVHPRVTELITQKQQKMEKLKKCKGTTESLKIAGISTLGITAVGIGANIAEAVVLKRKENELKTAKENLNDTMTQLEKAKAEKRKARKEELAVAELDGFNVGKDEKGNEYEQLLVNAGGDNVVTTKKMAKDELAEYCGANDVAFNTQGTIAYCNDKENKKAYYAKYKKIVSDEEYYCVYDFSDSIHQGLENCENRVWEDGRCLCDDDNKAEENNADEKPETYVLDGKCHRKLYAGKWVHAEYKDGTRKLIDICVIDKDACPSGSRRNACDKFQSCVLYWQDGAEKNGDYEKFMENPINYVCPADEKDKNEAEDKSHNEICKDIGGELSDNNCVVSKTKTVSRGNDIKQELERKVTGKGTVSGDNNWSQWKVTLNDKYTMNIIYNNIACTGSGRAFDKTEGECVSLCDRVEEAKIKNGQCVIDENVEVEFDKERGALRDYLETDDMVKNLDEVSNGSKTNNFVLSFTDTNETLPVYFSNVSCSGSAFEWNNATGKCENEKCRVVGEICRDLGGTIEESSECSKCLVTKQKKIMNELKELKPSRCSDVVIVGEGKTLMVSKCDKKHSFDITFTDIKCQAAGLEYQDKTHGCTGTKGTIK